MEITTSFIKKRMINGWIFDPVAPHELETYDIKYATASIGDGPGFAEMYIRDGEVSIYNELGDIINPTYHGFDLIEPKGGNTFHDSERMYFLINTAMLLTAEREDRKTQEKFRLLTPVRDVGESMMINRLSNDIRFIDVNHDDLGAGQLAERLVDLGWSDMGYPTAD